MDLVFELISFAAKGFIVFVTLAACVAITVRLVRRSRRGGGGYLEVKSLNERYEGLREGLQLGLARTRAEAKQVLKERKARDTAAEKTERPRVYVVDFDGDVLATATESLRNEVTAIIGAARPKDEVVVRLESGGGAVPHYGLASAQLRRLKEHDLRVTVCVDRVAASGGYMMACVADHIVAAPFAVVGSIGVVAQVPNLRRLLKKHDVDVEELTAGEFKRTISLFGEVTDKGRAKLQAQLEDTHVQFKAFIAQHRPALKLDLVATGEYWLGTAAKDLGLVDELRTSDAYLVAKAEQAEVVHVAFHGPAAWRERLMAGAAELVERAALRFVSRAEMLRLR